MAVIDIENQNSGRIGTALLLGSIGHAEVQIPFRSGLAGEECDDREENRDEKG
jgi:hypothetical protein